MVAHITSPTKKFNIKFLLSFFITHPKKSIT
ncbi:hypothetical protein FNP_0191 [Fusobacterium polymorphum ATCC 10953]|uniref:Uncharacterized protein n=1 Tax=Fusobacterium polymorphum ATCC 10953 TaxID=393480 RepID=A5TSY3_FUSNP|nr:hypothetical protein FNP_0191 [Fusobacterium polymorphum ATCC 10953]